MALSPDLDTAVAATRSVARVGFVLLSNSADPAPSTRVAALNVFPRLEALGFEPVVLFEPADGTECPDLSGHRERILRSGCAVVVFQKVHGPGVLALVRELRSAGVATVYMVCDLIDEAMARETDSTVVVTEFLRSLYPAPLREKIAVVHDGIERPDVVRSAPERASAGERATRAILVTSHALHRLPVLGVPPAGYEVEIVGRFPPETARVDRLRALYRALVGSTRWSDRVEILLDGANPRLRKVRWGVDVVYERLRVADIGIIPVEADEVDDGAGPVPAWKLKSENRLTLLMSAGLPVIATPIPAYEAVVEHGVNGFLARSRDDWRRTLALLRDPDLRREVGARARRSVETTFSVTAQAQRLSEVLRAALAQRRATRDRP